MDCPSCGAPVSAGSGSCQRCNWSLGTAGTVDTPGPSDSSDPDPDVTRIGPSTNTPSGSGTAQGERATLQPGQQFTTRYKILTLLGAGGMGEVYEAWDEVLRLPVALKIIRPQLSPDPYESQQLEERFRQELRLARQVTHTNVVRIHDLGEVGEVKYLTMQYVQGADLGMVLRRHGKLPIERALSIARQIAAGLAAVHHAGVVHRDLKPANIIVDSEDHALLTDFGIARSVDATTLHTMPGSLIGTLDYMSPEQARGEPADQRSDIYAFGLILYELLAGGRPRTKSDSALASLIARLEKGPPPLRTVVPDIPADTERIVSRCLAPDAAHRYQSLAELTTDLERLGPDGRAMVIPLPLGRRGLWLAVAALLSGLAVAGAVVWYATGRRAAAPPAPHEPLSVLIADVDNAAQDPVFEGSLEQALGVAIEGAPFINAYPRKDALALAKTFGAAARLDASAARLVAVREGIGSVLAGTIARRETGFELSVKALNPATGDVVDTSTARAATKGDVLQAVGRVAESLRRALGDTSPPNQLKAETFTAASLDAVKSYTIAQALSTDRKNDEAIQYYRKAVEQDPTFGRAYAGWATAAFDSGRRDEGQQMWNKALSFVDNMTERERYRTLGNYFLQVAHNNEKAIENYEKLVQKYPADLAGHNNLAVAYFSTLRLSDALREGRRAIDLYPKSLKFRGNYALYAMYASDFTVAADAARAILKENAAYVPAYLPLAMEALAIGNAGAATKVYEQAATTGAEGASLSAIGLADIALLEGRYADAVAILTPAIESDRKQQNTAGAATKTIALAEAHSALARAPQAASAIKDALALSREDPIIVPAARILLRGGQDDWAQLLIKELSDRLQPQSRAYARMLEAERAIARNRAGEAMDALAAARKLADLWLVRFTTGVAYETFGHHLEARDELDICAKRLGEATAVFLDDVPTFRYTAPLREWTARVRTASGTKPATTTR